MVAALAALSGCIDAKKSFNDYEGRIVDVICRNRPRRIDETRFHQVEPRFLAEACNAEPHGVRGAGLGIAAGGLKGGTGRVRGRVGEQIARAARC